MSRLFKTAAMLGATLIPTLPAYVLHAQPPAPTAKEAEKPKAKENGSPKAKQMGLSQVRQWVSSSSRSRLRNL